MGSGFHLFANLWAAVDQLVEPQVTEIYTRLFAWVGPLFQISAIMFLAVVSACVAAGHYGTIGRDLQPKMMRLFITAIALNVAFYGQYIAPLVLHGLPNAIVNAVGGNLPAGGAAGAFDNLFVDAFAVALKVVDGFGLLSLLNPRNLMVGCLAAIYVVASALCIAAGFLVWAGSQFLLFLMIALGPLPLFCMLFPATRRWFENWVSTLACGAFLQAMTIAVLVAMIEGAKPVLRQVLSSQAVPGGDQITTDLMRMVAACVIFVMLGAAMTRLPHWSQSVFGGAHAMAMRAVDALASAPANVAKAASSSVAGAASSGARMSAGGAPGASLSRAA